MCTRVLLIPNTLWLLVNIYWSIFIFSVNFMFYFTILILKVMIGKFWKTDSKPVSMLVGTHHSSQNLFWEQQWRRAAGFGGFFCFFFFVVMVCFFAFAFVLFLFVFTNHPAWFTESLAYLKNILDLTRNIENLKNPKRRLLSVYFC